MAILPYMALILPALPLFELLKNQFNVTLNNSCGLSVNSSTGYKIEENIFWGNPPNTTTGLLIYKSGSDENEVYLNEFYNLRIGQQFLDKNSSQTDSIVHIADTSVVIIKGALQVTGLQTYIHWLQQLDANNLSIYALPENELYYLMNFVETYTGRGTVFANNILCGLYGICEDEVRGERYGVRGEEVRGEENEVSGKRYEVRGEEAESRREKAESEENSYAPTLLQSYGLESINIIPNPTTGELWVDCRDAWSCVSNQKLTIENVEIFDIYGRNLTPLTSYLSPLTTLDISNLTSGLYFVKITTNTGEVVKKIVKQ